MKKEKKLRFRERKNSPAFQHIQCVYNDPDFKREIENLKEAIKNWEKANPDKIIGGTKLSSPPAVNELIENIESEYRMTEEHIWQYLENPESPIINPAIITAYVDEQGGYEKLIIEADVSVTIKDIKSNWHLIEMTKHEMKGQNQRERGNERPELVYKIKKAIKKGQALKEIKSQLLESNFNGYKTPPKWTYENIDSFCKKYLKDS